MKHSSRVLLPLILALTCAAYLPSLVNDFARLDDQSYLLDNPLVKQLSWDNVKAIFTSWTVGNYNPLTVLSFALEYHWAGLDPFIFHLDNLLLHLANTALVFYLVCGLCGSEAAALWTALFFGVHPMHVESVAWVSERKDVLFAFFYLLGLLSYLRGRTAAVYGFFILSLFSKPAAVTFPLVLVLIDHLQEGSGRCRPSRAKMPLFMLSAAFAAAALYAGQTPFMAYETLTPERDVFSFGQRLLLSGYCVWDYAVKAFVPLGLSVFYPYPKAQALAASPGMYYLCWVGLLGAAWLIGKKGGREVFFSAAFFLSTVFLNLPVFGVGYSLSGDRFTYLPYIGLFFGVTQAVPQKGRVWAIILGGAALVFACLTFQRCQVWKNEGALWQNVIHNYPRQAIGYNNLSEFYFRKGAYVPALALADKALALNSRYYTSHFYKGNIFLQMGRVPEALEEYTRAIALFPYYHQAYLHRGIAHYRNNDPQAALRDFNAALRLQPDYPPALTDRALLLHNGPRR